MAVSRDDEEALDRLTFLFSDFMATRGDFRRVAIHEKKGRSITGASPGPSGFA